LRPFKSRNESFWILNTWRILEGGTTGEGMEAVPLLLYFALCTASPCKNSNLNVLKRSHKVLHLGEKVKALNSVRKVCQGS
jgi:hypothetical protein